MSGDDSDLSVVNADESELRRPYDLGLPKIIKCARLRTDYLHGLGPLHHSTIVL